jgi:hypothetical protein
MKGVCAMFHIIEFNAPPPNDGGRAGASRRSDPLRVQRLTRAIVRLRPYVVEINEELVEVADLHFEDGTVAAQVPYARFHFVD